MGISSCLLGHSVRYDGRHKLRADVMAELGPLVEWVPVCPEVEAGMGVPREAVRLCRSGEDLRLVGVASGEDWTGRMRAFAEARIRELTLAGLHGFVLKSRSPSCGLHVPEHGGDGEEHAGRLTRGLFADALVCARPTLPIAEDADLPNGAAIAHFAERIFAYRRIVRLFGSRWNAGDLVRFHTVHKMQLLAHSRTLYTELGQLVAAPPPHSDAQRRYETVFMRALALPATSGRHVDVLTHCAGQLKDQLTAAERLGLAQAIEEYRLGRATRESALARLRAFAEAVNATYVLEQTYLDPYADRVPA